MKVLFVCRQNIGRSQMAEALYNQLHPGQADSAGTVVDQPGQTLRDAGAKMTIGVMQEFDADVSGNIRTQLTSTMLDGYGRIVVMSEPEHTPGWLRDHPNAVIWTIKDTKSATFDETRRTRDELRRRISSL